MDDLRPDAVAARVAAWHNRHPLARRITAAQVQSIGFVALPFVQRPGQALGEALADLPTLPLAAATLGPPPSAARGGSAESEPPFDSLPGRPQAGEPAVARRASLLAALQSWRSRRAARRRALDLVRNKAKLRAQALRPAFSERFLPGVSTAAAARWALRHGRLQAVTSGAVRRVMPDVRLTRDGGDLATLYLATAAIEVGKRRARVLLGDGPAAGALGGRLLSLPRVAGSLASLALAGALALGQAPDAAGPLQAMAQLAGSAWPHGRTDPHAAAQPAAAQVASAQQPASAPAAAGLPPDLAASSPQTESPAGVAIAAPTEAAALASAAASAATSAQAAEPSAPPPPGVVVAQPAPPPSVAPIAAPIAAPVAAPIAVPIAEPVAAAPSPPEQTSAQAPLPAAAQVPGQMPEQAPLKVAVSPLRPVLGQVRPTLDEETKAAARQAVDDLRAARGLPARQPAGAGQSAAPGVAGATQAVSTRVARTVAVQPAYALSTRLLRTRAESEQVLVAWRALLVRNPREALNVSVMPAGDDWRVVGWPFASREDAERARAVLASRGMRAEVLDF